MLRSCSGESDSKHSSSDRVEVVAPNCNDEGWEPETMPAMLFARPESVRRGVAILRLTTPSACPRIRLTSELTDSATMGFAGSNDEWRERDLNRSRDDWREMGTGESIMTASLARQEIGVGEARQEIEAGEVRQEIGVGDAISTTSLKVTLSGRGDDSRISVR